MGASQNQIAAINYYTSAKGIPIGGAIALISVLSYESKLNPGSQGHQPSETPGILNPHGAYGIASWNGPRQNDLLEYATKHGKSVSALDTQLDFVLTEIANKYPGSWSAIRSSASYKAIIPILVDEYENPKDKQREIDGAISIAAHLAALPPQPAPPAPIPQAPAPQAPPPVLPAPRPLPGLPPISATEAGLDAAILDNIAAMLDVLLAQRAAIDKRIAKLETAAAGFGKLQESQPPALQIPVANPAAITPQRSQTVFGITNWATTFSALPAVFTAGVGIFNAISHGQAPTTEEWGVIGASVSAILIGLNAKDKNVTGGTVPQTVEAQQRAKSSPV